MKAILHPAIALRWTDTVLALDLTAHMEPGSSHTYVTMETVPADAPLARFDGLPDHRSRAVLEARQRRGDTCVLARQGKRIVAFAWLARGPWRLRDAGLEFRLDPLEVIVYDFFTAPEYRGQGIMQHVIRRVAEVARAQGYRRLYARAEHLNAGSIAAMERVRFATLASITTVRLLRLFSFHTIDIAKDEETFYEHARRHLRTMRPGVLRWRRSGRTGIRIHLSTHAGD
jgi:GNAT superfamily N-acetyltransferase